MMIVMNVKLTSGNMANQAVLKRPLVLLALSPTETLTPVLRTSADNVLKDVQTACTWIVVSHSSSPLILTSILAASSATAITGSAAVTIFECTACHRGYQSVTA